MAGEAAAPNANGATKTADRRDAVIAEPSGLDLGRGRGLLVTAAIMAAALAGPPSAHAVPEEYNGNLVAFESYRSGSGDIYLVDADGGEATARNVTPHPAADRNPAWEPTRTLNGCPNSAQPVDTQRIAFESNRTVVGGAGGTFDIHTVFPDIPNNAGRDHQPVNVTQSPATDDTAPAWSPPAYGVGGAQPVMAYASAVADPAGGKRDIFVIDPATGKRVNLTNDPASDDANPDWAPWSVSREGDGYVAYDTDRGGTRQIWYVHVRDVDGDGVPEAVGPPVQATRLAAAASQPSWFHYFMPSNDGDGRVAHQLAYRTDVAGSSYLDILEHAYSPDTAPAPFEAFTVLPLTGDPGDDRAPSWSPLGSSIVYDSTRGDPGAVNRDIHVLRASGFAAREPLKPGPALTSHTAADVNPAWQGFPDCAQAIPRLPTPAPVTRTPKPSPGTGATGGSGAGTSPAGGGAVRPRPPSPAAIRLTVSRVRVTASGRRARRRVRVSLTVNLPARATIRLVRRSGRTVARRTFVLRRGSNSLMMRVPRAARHGLYRVSIRVPGATPATIARRVRLRR